MAITGGAMIRPRGVFAYTHFMHNVSVECITGADGIVSSPSYGTFVDNIHVFDGGGTEGFAFKIGSPDDGCGAPVTTVGGSYDSIHIRTATHHGLFLDGTSLNIINGVSLDQIQKHGILLEEASNLNVLTGLLLQDTSVIGSDLWNTIHITDGDDNLFDTVHITSTLHQHAADFSGGTGNKLGGARIKTPGVTSTFLETAAGDNDFGLTHQEWDYIGTIAAATGALRFPILADAVLLYVELWVGTAPTGAAIVVDVNLNGTTMFPTTTKPTIAISGFTNIAIPDTTALTTGDYLTVDIDQVGSTIAGADLTVTARYRSI